MKKVLAPIAGLMLVACTNNDAVVSSPDRAPDSISLQQIGRFNTHVFDGGAAEIPAYDSASRRLFVVNGDAANPRVDVLSMANPAAPTKIAEITFAAGEVANSVAVRNGIVAVAIEVTPKQNNGRAAFFMANADFTGVDTPVSSVPVGALPDMLTFTPDGTRVLVANEGEPNADYTVDPEGTVSIINIATLAAPVVQSVNFNSFDAMKSSLIASGIRIFGAFGAGGAVAGGSSVSQDLEPEYIAVSPDSTTAWVSLQENNAMARINIATATVTDVFPLGLKNLNVASNSFDAGDRDSDTVANAAAIKFQNAPVFGMYQPDAIAAYTVGTETFIVTANEGDAREYTGCAAVRGCVEAVRAGSGSYVLNAAAFPEAAALKTNTRLGRLNVTNATGDFDNDGQFDQIHAFGARSFSIFRGSNGALVFDSGNQIESIVSNLFPAAFNVSSTNNDLDNRSDDKGPEPEGLVLGQIGGKTYAFVGLERMGGVMVYDVTNPLFPTFELYFNNRLFTPGLSLATNVTANNASDGDLAPEGLMFVPAAQSPNGQPLLIVANETSGTTTIYQVNGGG